MKTQREWSAARGKGQQDARAALARLHADVAWLAGHWERVGLDECLDRLAEARRQLSAVGAALLRDHFVEVLSRDCVGPGDVQGILDLMYRVPVGPPVASSGVREGLHGPD